MKYLTVCSVVKDEPYLPEWVEYHRLVGVEQICLYDGGTFTAASVLKKQIAEGFVKIIMFPGANVQLSAYNHYLKHYGDQSRWIAFIDADEFVVPKTSNDLRILLQNYEEFGGLGVSWLIFGSSYHIYPTSGLQIENYTLRSRNDFKENRHIKSIVQSDCVLTTTGNAHAFVYNPRYYCVNEAYEPISGPFSRNTTEVIQLNHYHLRSYTDFLNKMQRGPADGVSYLKPERFFQCDRVANEVYDDCILRFAPYVKDRLRKLYS
ncbi:MAG TPA: glycosyltransferase family 2 protein [Candidatus Acidoferrum sp.]|nr:glycosyltransferase family 2 protein [Candidatus Acidoferrum sp.]